MVPIVDAFPRATRPCVPTARPNRPLSSDGTNVTAVNRRALLVALGAATAGCAGGGGDTPTSTSTPTGAGTVTATPTPGSSAREQFPNYDWSILDDATPTATTTITMRNFEFHPLIAAVEPGAEVTVVNEDGDGHTFTAPALDVGVTLSGGEQTMLAVQEPGTYEYVCEFHPPSMLGALRVTDDPDSVADSTETTTTDDTPTPTDSGETTTTTEGYY